MEGTAPRSWSPHGRIGVSIVGAMRVRGAGRLSRHQELTGVRRALSQRSVWLCPSRLGRDRAIYVNGKTAGTADARRLEAEKLVAELEPRERAGLERIVEGCSLVRIAGELGLSLEEAAQAKASLMSKLGASATADLVRIGLYAQVDRNR